MQAIVTTRIITFFVSKSHPEKKKKTLICHWLQLTQVLGHDSWHLNWLLNKPPTSPTASYRFVWYCSAGLGTRPPEIFHGGGFREIARRDAAADAQRRRGGSGGGLDEGEAIYVKCEDDFYADLCKYI